METKSLLYGLIGFFIGGFIVAVAATTFDKPVTKTDETTTGNMMNSLADKVGDDFDKTFISNMIEHHQGAIDMAEHAQENAKHDEIKAMAGDIITAQSKEIEMMQRWQAEWGYGATPESHDTTNH